VGEMMVSTEEDIKMGMLPFKHLEEIIRGEVRRRDLDSNPFSGRIDWYFRYIELDLGVLRRVKERGALVSKEMSCSIVEYFNF